MYSPFNIQDNTDKKFSAINFPYGNTLVSADDRIYPTSEAYGETNDFNKKNLNSNVNLNPGLNSSPGFRPDIRTIGEQNTETSNKMDKFLFNESNKTGVVGIPENYKLNLSTTHWQPDRAISTESNRYIQLAANSMHASPDVLMSVFFSDSNINHLRNVIVQKVKENTGNNGNPGIEIPLPNMDDFFNYLLNSFQNYRVYNGSICFVNLKKNTDIKSEISKLNTSVLQEYISRMVSQINMYLYYYRDASQMPEQLSLPQLSSQKGSKTLEYNVGFYSGNSIGASAYTQENEYY